MGKKRLNRHRSRYRFWSCWWDQHNIITGPESGRAEILLGNSSSCTGRMDARQSKSAHALKQTYTFTTTRNQGRICIRSWPNLEAILLNCSCLLQPFVALWLQLGLLTALEGGFCVPQGGFSFKKLLYPENWKVISISHTICSSHIKLKLAKIESSFMWLAGFTFTFF